MVTTEQLDDLTTLNQITETLNKALDVKTALDSALGLLIELMGLETGWIFLKDPTNQKRWAGKGYTLLATHNLPPALQLEQKAVWNDGCDCQGLCNKGNLISAYNEVRCSRLASAEGDKHSLSVHASVPLKSGERVLGILNVAAPDWSAFSPRALALLTNVGGQMGIALERARLYDLLRDQRMHEQVAMLEFSNQLLSRRDMVHVMDYLVEETRRLLQMDACSLLLPGPRRLRLHFRAVSGWYGNPVEEGRWLPNDERSGPGWVMISQQPLVVEDLEVDPQRAPWNAEWLSQEQFRGHAVMPLIVEGQSIGTLVVNTRQPRLLNEDELRFLHLLANQAALALENARLHDEDLKLQRVQEELAISQQIQLSMLPSDVPTFPGWQFAAKYKAARVVGGDFYDFFTVPDGENQLGIVIADVADKGIPAALFMALSRTIIRTTALTGRTPAAALARANELMLNDSQSDIFLTAFYAILNTQTAQMTYSSAGHNPPFWYHAATGQFEKLALKGLVLGVFHGVTLLEQTIQLEPEDVLIFYTDGVTEVMSAENEEFGEARLLGILRDNIHHSASEIQQAVIDAVNIFTFETPLSDDFTLIILKRASL